MNFSDPNPYAAPADVSTPEPGEAFDSGKEAMRIPTGLDRFIAGTMGFVCVLAGGLATLFVLTDGGFGTLLRAAILLIAAPVAGCGLYLFSYALARSRIVS